MRRPTITDYIFTLENPVGVFRTLGEIEVRRDIYGEPELLAGNSAAIFTYTNGNAICKNGETGLRFLKCYIRPNPHLRTIYAYIENARPALLPEARLLTDELYLLSVAGEAGWVDVVEGKWTEGETLGAAAGNALRTGDGARLKGLADAFDTLCSALSGQEWAHGDLKPDNIIVRPDGTLALVDCDAMWIPSLAGQKAAELGTPAYRHPGRTAAHFDKRIDDYPMALISACLRALALDPERWAEQTTDDVILLPVCEKSVENVLKSCDLQ